MKIRANKILTKGIKKNKVKSSVIVRDEVVEPIEKKSLVQELLNEGYEDFYNYLDWLDLAKDPDIIVLPPGNHYFYQAEDLEKTDTLVNLMSLNKFRDLSSFLNSIYKTMPEECFFTGCFIDATSSYSSIGQIGYSVEKTDKLFEEENGIKAGQGLIARLSRILDSKIYFEISSNYVKKILKDSGFKVLDMTELNNQTYFCAMKSQTIL